MLKSGICAIIPNMNNTEYISKEKLNELETELNHLKHTKRGEVAKDLERTRALGDLSENAEYHQAREEQGWTEDRIAQIEHIMRNAEIIEHKKSSSVALGSYVVIQKKGEKNKMNIEIVGGEEADVANGKISFLSPLGSELLGKKEGDKATIKTPKGESEYKIIEVK